MYVRRVLFFSLFLVVNLVIVSPVASETGEFFDIEAMTQERVETNGELQSHVGAATLGAGGATSEAILGNISKNTALTSRLSKYTNGLVKFGSRTLGGFVDFGGNLYSNLNNPDMTMGEAFAHAGGRTAVSVGFGLIGTALGTPAVGYVCSIAGGYTYDICAHYIQNPVEVDLANVTMLDEFGLETTQPDTADNNSAPGAGNGAHATTTDLSTEDLDSQNSADNYGGWDASADNPGEEGVNADTGADDNGNGEPDDQESDNDANSGGGWNDGSDSEDNAPGNDSGGGGNDSGGSSSGGGDSGGGGGFGCFVAGTKVWTPEGQKCIEKIIAGDFVWSHDFKSGSVVAREVVETMTVYRDGIVDVTLGDETLRCSNNHPFYTVKGKWVRASALKEAVFCREGSEAVSVSSVTGSYQVYNFEVKSTHNYFVGDSRVLVHNKK